MAHRVFTFLTAGFAFADANLSFSTRRAALQSHGRKRRRSAIRGGA
jgi:hypothetical protein